MKDISPFYGATDTPAWQPSHSLLHTCKQALVGFESGSFLATAHSMRPRQADSLPNELCRLGLCAVFFDKDEWQGERFLTCFEEWVTFVGCDLSKHHVKTQKVSGIHDWTCC